MGQKLLLVIGGGLIAAAVALGAVAASAGWGRGPAGFVPGGMMGAFGTAPSSSGQAISIDQAQSAVQATLDRQGNRDLAIDELIEFQDNFYASVREKSTGTGAFELLVNRSTGAVVPEPGPNMMWNTKYGMMSGRAVGMMGGGMMGVGIAAGPMTVTADQATQAARQWLDRNQPGSTTNTPDRFYGYYTVDVEKDGRLTGMLSVNGTTGQVWYHTWHGSFFQEKDLGA
ncbi:MAG TPA: hypothetical protein VLW53_18020 [Candidatus Eisenbacteria bacterium]|nr:hypothetical protein [Candidatus Eisenbacteria bacterium]